MTRSLLLHSGHLLPFPGRGVGWIGWGREFKDVVVVYSVIAAWIWVTAWISKLIWLLLVKQLVKKWLSPEFFRGKLNKPFPFYTVTSYLSSLSCCPCWRHGEHRLHMELLQYRPRPQQSPPAVQLRKGSQFQSCHQWQGMSELKLKDRMISINIYLGSVSIVVIATAMGISPLL